MPKYTIVFTDSGLGGLLSFANFYTFLNKAHGISYSEIDLLYFNALPESGAGYSKMKSRAQMVNTFNRALNALQNRYSPDIIAIACNTLSAAYPETTFANDNKHVIEIITAGRSQISIHIKQFRHEPILVFATPTTINSGVYHFDNPNVIPVSGGNLASLIEADYSSSSVRKCVRTIIQTANNKLKSEKIISIFLGCTHYGFIKEIFYELCQDYNFSINTILDPQEIFVDVLKTKIQSNDKSSNRETKINLKIESQAVIESFEIKSISSLLQNDHPEISTLLRNYTRLPKLF